MERPWRARLWTRLAALSGAASVLAGAFAAHGLAPQGRELMKTGAGYEMSHALACLAAVALVRWGAARARFAPALFLAGTVLFSGSLYALALGAPAWIGAITPLGGLAFLAGWAVLAWAASGIGPIESRGAN